MKFAALGVLLALAAMTAGSRSANAREAVVPLYVEHGPQGDPRLGIDVIVGPRTVRLLVSTKTTGMRVLARAVAGGPVERTGKPAASVYDDYLLHAEEARARLRFSGAEGTVSTTVALVDKVECIPSQPRCAAANGGTPDIFGGPFAGILGLGVVDLSFFECCRNPFKSFGRFRQRYIVHSALAAPSIILDPDDATRKNFTMVTIAGAQTALGCVRLDGGVTNEVCGELVFDTAAPDLTVTTSEALAPTPLPPRTTLTLTVGDWSHTYAIGPHTGPRLVMRKAIRKTIVVGLSALQFVDLLFDLTPESIGLRALDRGVAPAAKRRASLPALTGRWRCKSGEWPYSTVDLTFAADGTGRKTVFLQGPRIAWKNSFTYIRLDDASFAWQNAGSAWEEMDVTRHGDALDLRNGGYWHESHWTASSSAESYKCRRAAISFREQPGARRRNFFL